MTSRSSSWVDLRENNKRRLWQWCVALFFFVVINVVGFLISVMAVDTEYYIKNYGERAHEMLVWLMKDYAGMFMGTSALNILFTTALAIFLGIGGFAYLNNRTKIDFYESMPLKKGRRFSVIWLSGIIIFAGSYLIGMFINYGILVGAGYGEAYSMGEALRSFVILFAFFMGVYHLAILSVMLTGTTFVSVCAFVSLSIYEVAMRYICITYRDAFFRYSHTITEDYIPRLSPFGLLSFVLTDINMKTSSMLHMMLLGLFDLALLILCYVLYHKRPLETAGKTIVFKHTKPVIRLLLTIPVGAFVANIVYAILKDSSKNSMKAVLFTVLVTVLASILASALIQGIFEQDIRLAFKNRLNWVLCSAVAILMFFGFKYDWIRLDRYIPTPSMVSSAILLPEGYGNRFEGLEPDLSSTYLEDYSRKYMYLTDADSVCSLARLAIKTYDNEMALLGEDEYPEGGKFEIATVFFRLKNGHTMSRTLQIPVKDDMTITLLDKIMDTDEFRHGYYDIYNYDIEKAIRGTKINELDARYTDGIWSKSFTPDEIIELVSLYKKDLEESTYKDRLDEFPKGHVQFMINTNDRYGRCSDYDFSIYPCMKNCMDYIASKGYDVSTMDYRDDITLITVTRYHNDEADEYYESLEEGEEPDYDYVDSLRQTVFYDIDKIDDIVPHVTSNEVYTYRWDGGKGTEDDYSVEIEFAKDSELGSRFSGYMPTYAFIDGEVPDFVIADTE